MRLRICQQPTKTLDGVILENYRAGGVYDLGAQLADVFLAEGWAEHIDRDEAIISAPPIQLAALVLVVDDDTDLRRLTASVLSCNGYRVVEAQDGREAIGRLVAHTPDLVVLDLEMPVMDGWEFRAEQQRLSSGQLAAIPVLLLTGTDGADGHAATLRAVGLVQKPFDPEHLLDAIKEALGR
jgi:CheY-like chemotaxis protein